MHLLDFLPAAHWHHQLGDPLFAVFIELHAFLTAAGKLQATVDFDLGSPADAPVDGVPLTLGRLISKFTPAFVQRSLAAKSIRKWSAAKGHDLSFTLDFD